MSMDPYGQMYDNPGALGSASSMYAQAGQPSLPMQMMGAYPGIFASMGYSSFRGRNTLLKGGSKPGLFRTAPIADDFFALGFTKSSRMAKRQAKLAAGKTPFLRRALQQRNPMQFTDLSIFSSKAYGFGESVKRSGLYSPFGGAGILANTKTGARIGKRMTGLTLNEGERAFGPGLFAFMGAGTKIDRLERKAAAGNTRAQAKLAAVDQNISTLRTLGNNYDLSDDAVRARATEIGRAQRAAAIRAAQMEQAARIAGQVNPYADPASAGRTRGSGAPNFDAEIDARDARTGRRGRVGFEGTAEERAARRAARREVIEQARRAARPALYEPPITSLPAGARFAQPYELRYAAARLASPYEQAMAAIARGEAGVRGNLMASSAAGGFTQYGLGYARGALGFGGKAGLAGRALEGAGAAETKFAKAFVEAFGDSGFTTKSGRLVEGTEDAARAFLRSTGGQRFFREVGSSGLRKLASSGATKMLAMRAAALAIPGLQVAAAVTFVYDIGRLLGTGLKAGIDLARDAGVSLRGTIDKPAFGMGYKDTEAAATSRARGVMAIQNSRLNMRSLLGSEAGMMAAHYG